MGFVQVLSPTDWIIRITTGIIALIITGSLLRAELIKRKLENPEFQSQYLRYSSLSCLWFGVICSMLLILSVVPGFCMIRVIGSATVYLFQFLCLGLYQLSRLHYSFSKEQLHQKKGYPLWVFKVVITVGIILAFAMSMMYTMVLPPIAQCGYRANGYFFYEYKERGILFDVAYYTDRDAATTFYTIWFTLQLGIALWDITTLMLYLWKIWKIGIIHKSKMQGVWDNVLFILHRIAVVTVFYEFCHLITAILFPLLRYLTLTLPPDVESKVSIHRVATILLVSASVDSLAIFMMMDHNTSTYIHFLRVLRVLRLKYCCFCCCHRMVDQQLEVLGTEQLEVLGKATPTEDAKDKQSESTAATPPTTTNDTVFSNISKGAVYGLNGAMSISTRTNVNVQNLDPFQFHLPSIRTIAKIEQDDCGELKYAISDAPE